MSIKTHGGQGRSRFGKMHRRMFLFRVGALLLLLGLIAFSIYQCTEHITMGMTTLRTQEITENSYARLELYTFRDETPVVMNGNLFAYDVMNGERVGVHQTIAQAYTLSDVDKAAEEQVWLDTYAERLALAADGVSGNTVANVVNLATAVDTAYLALLESAGDGDLAGAFSYADRMLDHLNHYEALTGAVSEHALTPQSLMAQRDDLLTGLSPTDTLTTDVGGYFYYHTDGYETIFDYEAAMTMTRDEFLAMTTATPESSSLGTAGKMVYRATWYAATYVPVADAAIFDGQVGMTYLMTCVDDADTKVLMTLERVEYDTEGALLVFSSRSMPDGFDFGRRLNVEIVADTMSGYRIPSEAVVTLTGADGSEEQGVYILVGNVVEFRKISVLVRYEGYMVARTYEDAQAMLDSMREDERIAYEADGFTYLQLNDNIITRGTGLYDGKMVG